MATYTDSAPQYNGAGWTTDHTLADTYAGGGFTINPVGFSIDRDLGTPAFLSADRSGSTDAGGILTNDHTLANTYSGGRFSVDPVGFDMDQDVGPADWSSSNRSSPLGVAGGVSPGSLIPASYFRKVTGVVVDEEGTPLTDATYLYARDNLATGGQVDENGRFTLYLLRQQYSEFLLVSKSERPNVDYTWYQPQDTIIGPNDNEVVLVFKTAQIKGMYSGKGVEMGGQIG